MKSSTASLLSVSFQATCAHVSFFNFLGFVAVRDDTSAWPRFANRLGVERDCKGVSIASSLFTSFVGVQSSPAMAVLPSAPCAIAPRLGNALFHPMTPECFWLHFLSSTWLSWLPWIPLASLALLGYFGFLGFLRLPLASLGFLGFLLLPLASLAAVDFRWFPSASFASSRYY